MAHAPEPGSPAEPPPPDATVSGLPSVVAAAVERALRVVLLWVARGVAGLPPGEMERWERELLLAGWDPGARLPLAVLARELAEPAGPRRERIAWACLCVTEWALEAGAVSVGLAFADAAARAWPEQARYAWTAGRLLRAHGRDEAGESWLRRAAYVAEESGDWEGQARSLAGLVPT